MKQIYPDLWQGEKGVHAGVLTIRSYCLTRDNGNVLFYYTNLERDADQIEKLGGIHYQYLSHNHEINVGLIDFKKRFNHKLIAHHLVSDYMFGIMKLDEEFNLSKPEYHSDSILVIPTPGHTSNNLCYHYKSPYGKSYLFTGDTIYLDHGEWSTLIMPRDGGNREDLIKSLTTLQALNVDVVICSVALGENGVVEVAKNQWIELVDKLIKEVEKES